MKYLLLKLILIYKLFISPALKQVFGVKSFCRYSPTCSDYALSVIKKQGSAKGVFLSLKRIISCQPLKLNKFKYSI
ncbi:MAG TPA: membrane protein insertion efficiency factor YidD [Candidatus Limnocylindrales bacterium]|nr:membrane protein insertion efficiency factor YidD [Candidatus Limnocylindrales bacterium]